MRCLVAFLAISACAPTPPLVSTLNTPPTATRYAVEGDSTAAIELRRQLVARGIHAADADIIIRTGYAVAPRSVGTCASIDPATAVCKSWLYPPKAGFAPFAPSLSYRLTLAIDGSQIIASQSGGKSDDPLPALVTAAVDRLAPR